MEVAMMQFMMRLMHWSRDRRAIERRLDAILH